MNSKKLKSYIYSSIAFWLAVGGSIIPYFINSKPCMICLLERAFLAIISLTIWLGKWVKFLRKLSRILLIMLIILACYHLLVIFGLLAKPKICSLAPTFLEKVIKSCDNSSSVLAFGVLALSFVILSFLYAL